MRDEEKSKEQLISELAELRHTLSDLRESESDYRDLFECSVDGLAVIDAETLKIILCNKRATSLYGFESPNDAIGVNPLDFIHPEDKDRTIKHIVDYLFRQDLREVNVFRTLTKDGKDKWISAVGIVIDYHGKKAALASFRDITQSKLTEDALRESEEKLRLTFKSIDDSIIIIDPQGHVLDANEAAVRIAGFNSKNEVVGINAFDLISPQDRERVMRDFVARQERHFHQRMEYHIKPAYGNEFLAEITASSLLDSSGNLVGYIAVLRDITEQKRAVEELRKSEERYRLVAENVSDVIWIMDMNARYTYISPSVKRMRGYTSEEMMELPAHDLVTPESAALMLKALSEELTLELSGKADPHRVRTLEMESKNKDSSMIWLEVKITFMRDPEGKPIGILGVSRDITERKRTEGKLKESEKKYKELVEREKDIIFSVDASGHFTSINSAVLSWGFTPEQIIGRHFSEFILPEWHDVLPAALDQVISADEITAELVVSDSKGKGHPIEFSATVIKDGNEYGGVRGIVRDITERKLIEESLRASEQKLRLTFESIIEAIILTDIEGHIMDINEAGFRMSGYDLKSQVIGLHGLTFFREEDRPRILKELDELMKRGRSPILNFKIISKNGTAYDCESSAVLMRDNSGNPTGLIIVVRDVSERERAEEALKQRNRELATLNKVAESVSHPIGLNKVLKTALDSVLETMSFTHGSIWLLDKESKELKLASSRGAKYLQIAAATINKILETGEPIAATYYPEGKTAKSNKTLAVNDSEGKPIIGVPLKSKGEVLGVLGVVGDNQETSFDDMRLLETIGDQIAVAIENTQLVEKLNELSITDELTGLYNRRRFYEVLESEMNRTRRYGRCISLAMIDLDGFKKYNDRFGHASGDVILTDFASTLREGLRRTDTAFRYGGDEFIVILPSTNAERAKEVIERIRKKWLKRLAAQQPGKENVLGFSAGIAQFPENAETVDGLVFLTDTALYYAKRGGKQRVMLISDLGTSSLDVLSSPTLDQIYALAATVDTRDPFTYGHSKRVAAIAESLGRAIGLQGDDLSELVAAAFLHDIGKVGVADVILTKPGKPEKEEWEAIKKHCAEGAKIIKHVKELAPLAPYILHHHEWYDGSGYPDKLKGQKIPLAARIISVADAYDTMTAQRPYREAISPQEALKEIERCSGTQFDPKLIEALHRISHSGLQLD